MRHGIAPGLLVVFSAFLVTVVASLPLSFASPTGVLTPPVPPIAQSHALRPDPGGTPAATTAGSGYAGNTTAGTVAWLRLNESVWPSPRQWATFANDPDARGVILFGGSSLGTTALNDTWLYSRGSWTELCSGTSQYPFCGTSPPVRFGSEMVFDPVDGELVLFGGCELNCFLSLNDTWGFSQGAWWDLTDPHPNATNTPPGDAGVGMAYDAADGYVVLFEGSGATWTFTHDRWTHVHPAIAPTPRRGESIFYDTQSRSVVLWGGPDNQTWEFRAGNWTALSPEHSPPVGSGLGAAFDGTTGTGIVFGPANYSACLCGTNTTWFWTRGDWTNVTSAVGPAPPPGPGPSMDFDTSDGYTVLLTFVAAPDHPATNETWLLRDPLNLSLRASALVVDVGQQSTISATVGGGVGPYAFGFPGLPSGCSPGPPTATSVTVVCRALASGSFLFNVTATDAHGLVATFQLLWLVHPDPLATVRIQPNPTTVDVPVSFSASFVGGTGAISANWSFGDGGGFAGNSTTHAYAAPGTYVMTLTATDAAGFVFGSNQSAVVNSGIRLRASVDRTTTDVGNPVNFVATGSGGTGVLSYEWNFGNGRTVSGSACSAAFDSPGSLTPQLFVNDSVGSSAWASVSLVVNPSLAIEALTNRSTSEVGGSVAFTASVAGGTGPFSYQWTFSTGRTSASQEVVQTFVQVGNYTATLTVRDSAGASAQSTVPVEVVAAPVNPIGSPTQNSTAASLSVVELGGLGSITVAVAVLGAVLVARRRRREEGSRRIRTDPEAPPPSAASEVQPR